MTCYVPEELVGFGALLQYEDPITAEWNTVAGTSDLSLPGRMRESIDTSDASNDYEQRIPGPLKRLEPVTYEYKFLQTQWFRVEGLFEDGLTVPWRVVLNNPQQFYMEFCAFITSLGDAIPQRDLIRSTMTLQPSGAPTSGYLNT
jgi:hypothetical protein